MQINLLLILEVRAGVSRCSLKVSPPRPRGGGYRSTSRTGSERIVDPSSNHQAKQGQKKEKEKSAQGEEAAHQSAF